jgi:DNA repair protein RadC
MPRHYNTANETIAHYTQALATLNDTPHMERPTMNDPDEAYRLLAPFMTDADREHAFSITLDTKHRPLAVNIISTGSIDHTFMVPRDIIRDALIQNATALIVAHNHPSGDAEPSEDDERVTRRLAEATRVVGIELLDALVIGTAGRWTSMARRGII